jgi:predicted nuclease of predicted toxin-antitoxin system
MRLLLDENLPKRLKQDFKEHEIYTVADKGWTGISNGKLLALLTENEFDGLLTFDKNLQYQQNFTKYTIAVIVLNAADNSYTTLKQLVQKIKDVLTMDIKPGPIEISLEGQQRVG